MRAPKRRRPPRRAVGVPTGVNVEQVAACVTYVGSSEHKSFPSFAGPPAYRGADASKCDPSINDASVVTEWLRKAIRAGNTSQTWGGGFPRYVWGRVDGVPYEARLVNEVQGTYKGYPLEADEWLSIRWPRPGGELDA